VVATVSAPAAAGTAATPPPANEEARQAAAEEHPGAARAPMVGTVYLTPEPGAPPFITVGAEVSEGQTLLIIEAMKVMNPIRAARGGRIARLMVAHGDPVEYGELLLIIE
jgi:acetyl-CoA carboxylase biotin carboxyl carrier protein